MTLSDGRVRPTATLILFLLVAGEQSAWHRVSSSETWLAHRGRVVLETGGDGTAPGPAERAVVGVRTEEAERAQVLVAAGCWQRTLPSTQDALVSCLVSPGFDFEDFELA